MEGAEEGDGPRPSGVPAGQLQARFERLGPAVGEEDALGPGAGRQLRQLLGQVDLRLIVEIGAGHVQQLVGLVLDGGDDLGMAVPRRRDRDAGREIEKEIAVHVLDDRAAAAGTDQRINARVGRRHALGVALAAAPAPWGRAAAFSAREPCIDRKGTCLPPALREWMSFQRCFICQREDEITD